MRHHLRPLLLLALLTVAPSAPAEDGGPLYLSANKDGNWDIYSCDSRGRNERRLTATPWDERDLALSPDRSRLVFVATDGFIKIMDVATAGITDSFPATGPSGHGSQPSFYDSDVVFSNLIDIQRDYSVISIRRDGTPRELITKRASVFFPTPVPGTRDLAYAYRLCIIDCGTFVSELWYYDAVKRHNRQITLEGAFIIDPVFLDTATCFFVSNKQGTMDIYRLDIASRTVTPVVTGPAEELSPAVSPDGKRLAYLARSAGETTVCIRDLADGATATLSPIAGRYLDLVW